MITRITLKLLAALMMMRRMDVQLAYNPALRCCDVVFDGTDFALDATPASAMLFSLLANRRAHTDDTVPIAVPDWAHPTSFFARGGYPGDALDANGALVGSRLWLYVRCLASDTSLIGEQTRQNIENAVVEAVTWLETIRSLALQVIVRYITPQIIAYSVKAGTTTVELPAIAG